MIVVFIQLVLIPYNKVMKKLNKSVNKNLILVMTHLILTGEIMETVRHLLKINKIVALVGLHQSLL